MAGENNADPNLQEIHDFLIDLAVKAGKVITSSLPRIDSTASKKNSEYPLYHNWPDRRKEKKRPTGKDVNILTDVPRFRSGHWVWPRCWKDGFRSLEDTLSKLRVRNTLGSHANTQFFTNRSLWSFIFPSFHGEETYDPAHPLTDAPTFVVDPIDGTVNFVHGFPNSCISLGFAVNRKPVVGVVYNPFTETLYSAIHGQGAFLNRKTPLPLKGTDTEPLNGLDNALIGLEWGSDRSGRNWETKVRTFENLGKTREDGGAMVHSIRSMGSAALNLCAVASGTLDLYWEGGCWAWDVCAGWVILTEAGGIMVGGNPGKWDAELDGRTYLAVRPSPNGQGQKELVEEFWSHIQGRLEY